MPDKVTEVGSSIREVFIIMKMLEMSHYMKKVVASVKTKGQSQHVTTKNMTKPMNKPVPKMVQKWVPKIATPAKSVDPK
jgi:23S rRNA maturation mini-RNase III